MATARHALALSCSLLVHACLDPTIGASATEEPPATTSTSTGAVPTTSGGATPGTTTGDATGTTTTASTGVTPGSTGSTGEAIEPPTIDKVVFPTEIVAAGPVELEVWTQHTAKVTASIAGIAFDMSLDGSKGGVFTGIVPIHSPDKGEHTLMVFAQNGDLPPAQEQREFTVKVPATGTLAWEKFGPPGSVTEALAVSDGAIVYEVGAIEVDALERPSLQLRSGITGEALWPEGPHQLDDREGRAVAVAVAADGDVWVAMNIRDGGQWRPRIVQLELSGTPTDLDIEGAPGTSVQALAADDIGGCIAVGFGPSPMGDSDVRIWRLNHKAEPLIDGQAWDYQPKGQEHEFSDFAFAVAVDGDAAWIAGASHGKHDLPPEVRGMILRVDVDTLESLGPVLVAPSLGVMTQSTFNGAALAPDGLLVTGNECDKSCTHQRISLTHYTPDGLRTARYVGPQMSVAHGASVARNTHGVSLVAANEKPALVLRGSMLGHVAGSKPVFDVPLPGQTSETAAAAAGPYGWMFWGGSTTSNQIRRAHVAKLHP